jgi:hypothetical protein
MNIVILSAACCNPVFAAFDEKAQKIIELAIKETGVEAEIKLISATTAMYSSAVPKHVMTDLINKFTRGDSESVPAILINGQVISYGTPQLEDMKTILNKFKEINNKIQE